MDKGDTVIDSDKLLPREELIKLLCTTDGKGQWVKVLELAKMFNAIDDTATRLDELYEMWTEVKLLEDERTAQIEFLQSDRDKWKSVALEYEARLTEENLL